MKICQWLYRNIKSNAYVGHLDLCTNKYAKIGVCIKMHFYAKFKLHEFGTGYLHTIFFGALQAYFCC